MGKRVFISHSSKDKPAVEALALALSKRGIDPWLDKWEIGPGDDIVASINRGLDEAGACLVVFSAQSNDSRWMRAEVSYLTWAHIEEGKVLIPVMVGEGATVPPLLRPFARRGIEEVDAIADALLNRVARPAASPDPELGHTRRVLVSLGREDDGVVVAVRIGDEEHARHSLPELPPALADAQAAFLRGLRTGIRRNPTAAERASLESGLAQLGRALRHVCLPGDSGEAISTLVDGAIGTTVEVCFEAEDPALLGLPFEALRLPDDRPLALQRSVVMLRRLAGVTGGDGEALAGPLKVLVAVGAPDEGNTSAGVLDQERELQNILDAVTVAQRHENFEVRILEVGNAGPIADAFAADAYHVLHISCHGMPGALELEDEEGRAVRTTADELVQPIRETSRPLPLVLLNSCHGGVSEGHTASLAEALLRAGVPAVVAMQTTVSDHYATEFARAFYHHLSSREHLLASRALAAARKELERARQEAVARGTASLAETQPEFATPSLYVAGDERPLADFARELRPLSVRPVYEVAGPVPQLRIDDLIGRRKELRETLRTLRDPSRQYAGVVLTGIGGVGKSALAGRVMQRLSEDGWLVPAHRGRFDIQSIATAIGVELIGPDQPDDRRKFGQLLVSGETDDRVRLQLVAKVLAEHPVLLVLDDFEQNLPPGGGTFLDPDVGDYLRLLAESARRGRLLLTCRYPVPGTEDWLCRVAVGPLSRAESLKLLQRLPALREFEDADEALRVIGGHPRILEFMDALLRGGSGRLPHVTQKLREVLRKSGDGSRGTQQQSDEDELSKAIALGARDVLLSELLDIARSEGIDEALLQVAVSNLPVEAAGLARMLADNESAGDVDGAMRALERLADLSLVHRFPDGSAWVHRWTAEGIVRLVDGRGQPARHVRAGRYRWWRVENESHALDDAVESVRNFLSATDFDSAVVVATACFGALKRFQHSIGLAALAAEVLETLPATHPGFASVADEEAKAHLALGFTERALVRYRNLLADHEHLVQTESDRVDYLRQLSVTYSKLGDLYRDLGQGAQAREYYLRDLQIAERLAQAEPERAAYQRDLSVSYNKVGNLYRALGQGEQAHQSYLAALQIAERLAQAEPDRVDYQRDLSISYNTVGDLYDDLGQGEQARRAYDASLQIIQRLAQAEPERVVYQRDLAACYQRVGDFYRDRGQGDQAHQAYQELLKIFHRLAQAEPDRADYQRDLSVSYNKVGDLHYDLGQGEQARQAYDASLQIIQRLAQAEPDRADYQRDLSVSYERMGDVYGALGQGEEARQSYVTSLQIRERLAQAEPDRADYQRDLAASYQRIGDLYRDFGQGEQARQSYVKLIQIVERLTQAEPGRADYQRDLALSYNKVGDLHRDQGQAEQARQSYFASLQIRERLAQAEPDRADYQRDVVSSLLRIGIIGDDVADREANLRQALRIVAVMRDKGQLAPADKGLVDGVNKLLRDLTGE